VYVRSAAIEPESPLPSQLRLEGRLFPSPVYVLTVPPGRAIWIVPGLDEVCVAERRGESDRSMTRASPASETAGVYPDHALLGSRLYGLAAGKYHESGGRGKKKHSRFSHEILSTYEKYARGPWTKVGG
jgi:hypothetical protein